MALWCGGPFLVLYELRELFPYETNDWFVSFAWLCSPLTLFLRFELLNRQCLDTQPAIYLIWANLLIDGGILLFVRWFCLRRADKLLGRIP